MTPDELNDILSDPLLDISEHETALFDMPEDMQHVQERRQADYVAQHKPCRDFARFEPRFRLVQAELRSGRRSLVRITKTANLEAGRFFIVGGQMVLLESITSRSINGNGLRDGLTRCIYENGTEADIMLQTLRKSVVADGYGITEPEPQSVEEMFRRASLADGDCVTGYIYVLASLSTDPAVAAIKNLYKIGFTTQTVEERTRGAEHEPTYLMAAVSIKASYKVANINSQKLEELIHKVLRPAQMDVRVVDEHGVEHHPKEWYQVPLNVVDQVVARIADGSIVNYTYNPHEQCLERIAPSNKAGVNTAGLRVLRLNVRQSELARLRSGGQTEVRCELKQHSMKRFLRKDPASNSWMLRRYDLLRLASRSDELLAKIDAIRFDADAQAVVYALRACLTTGDSVVQD